jgi:hypothetical protein
MQILPGASCCQVQVAELNAAVVIRGICLVDIDGVVGSRFCMVVAIVGIV